MYYNSNKNNNDYYNSYKKEISEREAYRKEENRQKIMRLLLSILALSLFILATFYLYKYFNPVLDSKSNPLEKIVIREEVLPISIQLSNSSKESTQNSHTHTTDVAIQEKQKVVSSMNEKDIALIVQIIMSQMNTKIERSLEKQLEEVNNKKFINKSLKETNHYNKVVLTKNKNQEIKNTKLMELSTNLNNIVNEEVDSNSNYTQEITKEVYFRKNEMRIIVVQKGDTLSKIAKKAYGDYNDYPKIFSANPEIIKNPDQIFVGQRLRIPS
ncbi:MAG: Unknown protein [uncultured Sulfurovum sp.]|uniref:LysM domain-containing protein n=1 Tax=uncultured Sulfurovum sp. TaxID=269237 RepID=A0A6S6SNI7_9BACT|nr:MAG: Unknown protein [uncultured Sulfurovum sp.]